jgi:hypothetical protein
MKQSIKIYYGEYGYFLKVNDKAIKRDVNSFSGVKATRCEYKPNNWIATEWASLGDLKDFWHKYMNLILFEVGSN